MYPGVDSKFNHLHEWVTAKVNGVHVGYLSNDQSHRVLRSVLCVLCPDLVAIRSLQFC